MKKHFLIIPLILLLCFSFGCEKEDDAAEEAMEMQGLTDAQRSEIMDALRTNYEQYLAAMMEMNVDNMFSYYSDTAFGEVLMGINAYMSKDAFKNMVVEMMEGRESQGGGNLEMRIDVLSEDAAYVSASYDYTINYEDGRVFDGKSVQTQIWKKEADAWTITRDHFSWAGKFQEE